MENQTPEPSNIIHYIAYTLLSVIILGLAYMQFMPKKEPLYVENEIEQVRFENLPYSVQSQYKTNSEYKKIEAKLNTALEEKQNYVEEISSLQQQITAQVIEAAAIKENIQEVPQEVNTRPSSMKAETSNEIDDDIAKRIKAFAKCYDMEVGKYNITTSCKKEIIDFVDKHPNAKYFEIIGIIDETEFTLYKSLENNNFIYDKLKVTQHTIDTMKKLSQSGLAKLRAIEGNWVIKSHTNKQAKVYNANYNLLSDNGKKGFVIRAYE